MHTHKLKEMKMLIWFRSSLLVQVNFAILLSNSEWIEVYVMLKCYILYLVLKVIQKWDILR